MSIHSSTLRNLQVVGQNHSDIAGFEFDTDIRIVNNHIKQIVQSTDLADSWDWAHHGTPEPDFMSNSPRHILMMFWAHFDMWRPIPGFWN